MPTFNFNIIKKVFKKSKPKIIQNIILNNVEGIVWIDNKANYHIIVNGNLSYDISPECYSCKNHETIYSQCNTEHGVVYIRHKDNLIEQNPNYWLPFDVGCIVKGDVILNDANKQVFVIKRCYVDKDNEECKLARKHYRKHLNEIKQIIQSRRHIDEP